MPKMIQIRNVPDDVHRRLKAKAAAAGMSLSDYLLREVTELAELLTWDEITERLSRLPPPRPGPSAVEIIRTARDAADRLPADASTVEVIRATRDAGDPPPAGRQYRRSSRKKAAEARDRQR